MLKKYLLGIILFIVIAVAVGVIVYFQLLSPASSNIDEGGQVPFIESITPSQGSIGTNLKIEGKGFTSNNDVAFRLAQVSEGREIGYASNIASSDTTTLTFVLPEALGVCAYSQMTDDTACSAIALLLPQGETDIWVINKNGESNKMKLRILPSD